MEAKKQIPIFSTAVIRTELYDFCSQVKPEVFNLIRCPEAYINESFCFMGIRMQLNTELTDTTYE